MHDQHAIKIGGEGARKSKYHPRESIIDDMHSRYAELIKSHKSLNPAPEEHKSIHSKVLK